ncbi:sporulation integral membrane protein YtvI [Bacillus massilinigeriensis]|uniref:sporulation integral membrane protein YtvI n=1 Tax=Bacillus massilionigeriensis TaxID=1805475 RepID=UPI00096B1732|nr:sporulation integral membrane protein YtvI [Bacillus massilionigeriensis]
MWKKRIIILVSIVIVFLIIPYGLPLIFALATAVLLEGLVGWFQKRFKFSRLQAVIATFLSYIIALMILGYNLFATIVKQIINLSQNTPTFVKDFYVTAILPLIRKWEKYSETLPTEVITSTEKTIENAVNSLDSFLQGILQAMINLVTAIPGFLIEFIIYLVALFLFSLELQKIKNNIKDHLTLETKKKVSLVLNQLTKAGVGFVKAQIIFSLLTFILAFAGLSILKASHVVLLSLLIVVVDILPILGTGSVLVPWGVVAILQQRELFGVGLIILFAIITVVRRIIEPKVYASNLGISALASLISLYLGFKILGFIGLFVGPAIVIVFDTLRKANIIPTNFKL